MDLLDQGPDSQPRRAFRGLSSDEDDEDDSSNDSSLEPEWRIAHKKRRLAPAPAYAGPPPDSTTGHSSTASEEPAFLAAALREEESSEACGEFEGASDVEAALASLRPRRRPRVVLKHLLYSVVSNRTLVDRDILELASAGRVRLVQLPSSANDVGVLLASDWRDECQQRLAPSLAERFLVVSLRSADLYIHRRQLANDDADQLCRAGLLRPRREAPVDDTFWLACPNYGPLAKRLQNGRDLLRKALRSARYREINIDRPSSNAGRRMSALLALDDPANPSYCDGGLLFLANDLVGRQLATLENKPAGRFLRLVA